MKKINFLLIRKVKGAELKYGVWLDWNGSTKVLKSTYRGLGYGKGHFPAKITLRSTKSIEKKPARTVTFRKAYAITNNGTTVGWKYFPIKKDSKGISVTALHAMF